MALPVINTPTYEFVVPSTKQTVKCRPFLVKEEKALLIAQQSEDSNVMINTLKNIITGCTFGKLDVEKLAVFDIEYIFVQLRARSVGEISTLTFNCLECNDPKAKMRVDIDLTKLEVAFNPEHASDIKLTEDVGVKMKYPDLNILKKITKSDSDDVSDIFDLIVSCIDYIYDSENVYHAKEQSKEELTAFVDNLTPDQFLKIQKFFDTMPKFEKTIEFTCPVCGFNHSQTLSGIDGFF